jgi:hypothetical protein
MAKRVIGNTSGSLGMLIAISTRENNGYARDKRPTS